MSFCSRVLFNGSFPRACGRFHNYLVVAVFFDYRLTYIASFKVLLKPYKLDEYTVLSRQTRSFQGSLTITSNQLKILRLVEHAVLTSLP